MLTNPLSYSGPHRCSKHICGRSNRYNANNVKYSITFFRKLPISLYLEPWSCHRFSMLVTRFYFRNLLQFEEMILTTSFSKQFKYFCFKNDTELLSKSYPVIYSNYVSKQLIINLTVEIETNACWLIPSLLFITTDYIGNPNFRDH